MRSPLSPFSLLLKPASADCNLRCRYCFYLDHLDFYPDERLHRMSEETLDRTIAGFLATDQPQHVFAWQGGEPTLMGEDFFRRVTDLQTKHGRRGTVIGNGVQTNGTRITDEMARHFAEYHFLVGVSLDGPETIHDRYRLSAAGRGSHADVMAGIRRLQEHRVEFNIVVLVSEANVRRAREVYGWLRDQGFRFQQYVPCVEFDESGRLQPYAIDGEAWGSFLCALHDEWAANDTRTVSIRLFDSILNVLVNKQPTVCHMDRDCRQYFAVEYNGDVYPCDFYVRREMRLGNVLEQSWEEMGRSAVYQRFGRTKTQWNEECTTCPYLHLCAGDCPKDRRSAPPSSARPVSWLCAGWKHFYGHTLPTFRRLAESLRASPRAAEPTNLLGRGQSGTLMPCRRFCE